MTKILFNDNFFNDTLMIDIEDRGYQFGDGVYEVIGIYGGKTFKMIEHLERLKKSALAIDLNFEYSIKDLEVKLVKLLTINKIVNGTIYIQMSRGVANRTHYFPRPPVNNVVVAYTQEKELPKTIQKKGVHCILTDDIRWLRCDIKSLNLLGSVLAKEEALKKNCFEAILCRNDIITEGSATNLFMVKENKVYTHPPNNYILNGITRKILIELCKKNGIIVIEDTFNKHQLIQADEVFLTGTFIDIVPVNKIDNYDIGVGKPGFLTKYLQKKLNNIIFIE